MIEDIRRFIVNQFLFGDEGDLTNDGSLLELGVIDSTGVLELVSHLERTYKIKVADSELVPENLDSISRITAYVRRKQPESESV